MECCFDCRYFAPEGKDASELTEDDWNGGACEGECRCGPPHLGDIVPQKDDDLWRTYGIWPRVLGSNWCGAFVLRKQSTSPDPAPVDTTEGK
jgi:hypothetical protein